MSDSSPTDDTALVRVAAPLLSGIRQVAAGLADSGWAEANAGNLSYRLDAAPELTDPQARIPEPLPSLGSAGILITAAGTRMRGIAADPLPGLCLLAFDREGSAYRTAGRGMPSSELPAHLAVHAVLAERRPEHRALVHTHPTHLVALSHRYPEPQSLVALLLRMHSEMAPLRDRLAALPFMEPGSKQLASATARAFEKNLAVIWPRHGIVASGSDFGSALDLIQVCNKAAQTALLAGPVPHPAATRGKPAGRGRSLRGWNAPDGIETFYDVKSRDSQLPPDEFRKLERRPIHVVLDNLRSAFNTGSIFRLADAARIAEVIPCGYTACPPHHKLEQTALGATDSVPWRRFEETTAALKQLKTEGVRIVGVETARNAVAYHRLEYRFPVAVVFGNEALGLSQSVLRLCDDVVEIPVFGFKNSVNVATAAAIVLYHLLEAGGWLDPPPDT